MNKQLLRSTLIVFLTITFFSNPLLQAMTLEQETQKNPATIVFDLDDTLITTQSWWRNAYIFWKALWSGNVLNAKKLQSARAEDAYGNKRFMAGTTDKTGNPELAPGGGATSLAFYGIHGKNGPALQSFIPTILEANFEYTVFLPGANILLDYLKNTKQLNIVYATNKDYTSYIKTAEKMDSKYLPAFSAYPTFTLVTQPTLSWLASKLQPTESMPATFKELVQEINDAQEKEPIFFAKGHEKPEDGYYTLLQEKIRAHIQNHGKIVFFDDKKHNIDGAKKNGITASYQVREHKEVADIVEGLEKEGILSPEADKALYKALAQEGIVIPKVVDKKNICEKKGQKASQCTIL